MAIRQWNLNDPPPEPVRKARTGGRQFNPSLGQTPAQPRQRPSRRKPGPRLSEILPITTKVQAAKQKRVGKQIADIQEERTQVKGQKDWEQSSEGQQRMSDISDYATAQHNKIAKERPELGLTVKGPGEHVGVTKPQLYEHYGFKQKDPGPGIGQRQLPGFEDPDALAQPKRWEEHTPEEQADIQRRVKAKSGATIDSMTRSFGSQLDQSYVRAQSHKSDTPYASDFYTSGAPHQRLKQTAKDTGVSHGLVAAVNADTSPQMQFSFRDKSGNISYPNAEQAEHAIKYVQGGGDTRTAPAIRAKKKGLGGTMAATGFDKNFVKATRRARQVIRRGKTVAQTFASTKKGATGFGPKTAAYHNSWLTSTPDFLVSDVHTGGGGMLPHLSGAKPLMKNEKGEQLYTTSGKKRRDKSEQEKIIAEPGFHAMADYAARQALHARGLGKIRQAQGAQWGEEQIRTGDVKEEHAYPSIAHPVQFPGKGYRTEQKRMF